MKRVFYKSFIFLVLVLTSAFNAMAEDHGDHEGHGAGQLQQGRYVGYVKMDGRDEKLALQADFFQESPEDFTQFPIMKTIFKLSLGGFHTTEYTTFNFENLHYNFETGDISFDEPTNDLVLTGQIHSMDDRVHIQGKAWSRTSATSGVFSLTLVTDEPGGNDEIPDENSNSLFAPLLDGQYQGQCGDKKAVFQIQTVKSLRQRDPSDGKEILDYEIVGRVGFERAPETGITIPWETMGSFAGGSYNPYRGKLVFTGPSTSAIDCARNKGALSCSYRIQSGRVNCDFQRESLGVHSSDVFPRQYKVVTTAEQLQTLPEPGMIADADLAALLQGDFNGYLHHEASDLYQKVELHVDSRVSTENPHNPNKVFISTTSMMLYGAQENDLFISQRYEPRSFYIRPGFSLSAPGSDSFIQIEQWKKGYIRGVWYSKEFGRVGVVEFIKGSKASLNSNKAAIMPYWRGEFKTISAIGETEINRWFNVDLPSLAAEKPSSVVPFNGAYQAIEGMTPIEHMEKGTFDPYTGAVGWLFKQDEAVSVVSGRLVNDGSLMMFWPPFPNIFQAALKDYRPVLFKRVSE
jgi:hypothetical protein